ncbi:Vitamin B12 ABC transporter, permease component BtuC [Pelagibacterium halotolerans B2]|uniref:Vitamin B12 ABC transporter, permease component BtuC n=1 Tax=Pelagibacterium halotolerans (strain DSM 22347 / JCM 15775 / CGMCC 1.7692 / B2) TaxID=1082931 RepID=G4RAY5_PELHB|nr:Vitamin B12 ABC transporter, permease component BtuC [Pelagibacterium halotolerans B2]
MTLSFAAFVALVIFGFLILLARGTVFIPIDEVVRILLGGEADRDIHRVIVMDARLPKAITAILAGAALGVGGALMQTLFRNPLADPFVLGVSSGAVLGAAIVILGTSTTGWLSGLAIVGQLGVTGAAVAGAGLVLVLALAFARRVGNPTTVLIVGVMFGFLSGALVDVLVYYADPERLQGLASFTRGTVRDVSWYDLQIVAPACISVILVSVLLAKPMNILLLGEHYAATMGIKVRPIQFMALALVAVLAGVVTAYCGAIGFVGLAAPHLVRGVLRDSDHFVVLPGSALVGALLVLLAEYVAGGNGLTNVSLPLNSVTAFVGAPVVLWVLLRRRREAGQVPT